MITGINPPKTALLIAAGGLAMTLSAPPASASEGGASLYLLGSGGPGAAELPPVRGVFFDNTFYYYDARSGGERQFTLGGNVVADLHAQVVADFATVLWVPSTDFLGGTLAVGASLPMARPNVDALVVLTGPLGNQVSASRHDAATVIGDPVVMGQISWRVGGIAIAASTQINIPVGNYREGQLANLAFHRWAEDFSLAASWRPAGRHFDLSAKVGITANGTNDLTDYDSGSEFHAEASFEYLVSPAFSIGAQLYHFQQVTGDNGSGAVLGPFEGRISGVGATAAWNFEMGRTPMTLRSRLFTEFGAENRLEGTVAMLSLSLPLAMQLPPGQGE